MKRVLIPLLCLALLAGCSVRPDASSPSSQPASMASDPGPAPEDLPQASLIPEDYDQSAAILPLRDPEVLTLYTLSTPWDREAVPMYLPLPWETGGQFTCADLLDLPGFFAHQLSSEGCTLYLDGGSAVLRLSSSYLSDSYLNPLFRTLRENVEGLTQFWVEFPGDDGSLRREAYALADHPMPELSMEDLSRLRAELREAAQDDPELIMSSSQPLSEEEFLEFFPAAALMPKDDSRELCRFLHLFYAPLSEIPSDFSSPKELSDADLIRVAIANVPYYSWYREPYSALTAYASDTGGVLVEDLDAAFHRLFGDSVQADHLAAWGETGLWTYRPYAGIYTPAHKGTEGTPLLSALCALLPAGGRRVRGGLHPASHLLAGRPILPAGGQGMVG